MERCRRPVRVMSGSSLSAWWMAAGVGIAALACGSSGLDSADFQRASAISISTGLNVYWNISSTTIVIGLEAATTGWVGIGVGEPGSGSMPGADIAICSNHGGTVSVSDYFATAKAAPTRDGRQDWTLLSSEVTATKIECIITRQLDTGEVFADRAIVNDTHPTKLIFAHGTTVEGTEPTLTWYHQSNRWVSSINLFSVVTPLAEITAMVDYAGDSLLVANDNFAVPTPGTTDSTTTYADQCTNVPSGTNSSLIAFAAELDSRSEAYIHHYTISGYPLPNCQGAKSLFGVWTPGNIPVVLPPTVGFPVGADFGSSHAFQSFELNTHFDNPTSVSGIIDSSGLRLYLTPNDTRREIEAGVLQLGDPDVALQSGADTFIAPGNTKHDFSCGTTATTAWAHDITVVTHFLHMHAIGVKQETIVTRGTATVFHGEIEYYEFALQSPVGRPNGYTLQRGDSINTTCYYTHSGGATSKKWGLSSEDEMCIDFVTYYPKLVGIEKCGGPGQGGEYLGKSTVTTIPKDFGGPEALIAPSTASPTLAPTEQTAASDGSSGSDGIVAIAVGSGVAVIVVVAVVVLVVSQRAKRRTSVQSPTPNGAAAYNNAMRASSGGFGP
eukprot:m.226367 g.226367  ORF g.226367 m.226367 type:complete len:611 (+) comp25928_c2_seq1:2477-4309(+)